MHMAPMFAILRAGHPYTGFWPNEWCSDQRLLLPIRRQPLDTCESLGEPRKSSLLVSILIDLDPSPEKPRVVRLEFPPQPASRSISALSHVAREQTCLRRRCP